MKPVEIRDIFEFYTLGAVKASPDGGYIAYCASRADEAKNGYDAGIYVYDTASGESKRLAASGGDRAPFWLDEHTLLFASSRGEKPEKPATAFYAIDPHGGEAVPAFTVSGEASISGAIDSDRLVMCVTAHEGGELEKDEICDVFDEIPFWSNGSGAVNKIRTSIGVYSRSAGEYTRVSPEYMDVTSAAISPDRGKILFSGRTYTDKLRRPSGIYLYDTASGNMREIKDQASGGVEGVEFIDDQTAFVAINALADSHSNPSYYKLSLDTGALVRLASPDTSFSSIIRRDGAIYISYAEWSWTRVAKVEPNGAFTPVNGEGETITGWDISRGELYYAGAARDCLYELKVEGVSGEKRSLAAPNAKYLASRAVSPIERFTFAGLSGVEIEGFVVKPYGYIEGRSYPALFEIHGGPKVVYGAAFDHEMRSLAARGYFVIFTNPRGSDGRGSDFADVTGKLGTIDYEDLMRFLDVTLERYPDIDKNRLGVLGGSYGGFMTNWIIGHTNRFAAAASQRSIASYLTKPLTTDIGFFHNMSQLKTDIWHDFETCWRTSPLAYANNAVTPTLFIHSNEDYRCWMSEGLQMYTALKQRGVEPRLCLFKGENHELSRSGKPKGRLRRLEEIAAWMDNHLQK